MELNPNPDLTDYPEFEDLPDSTVRAPEYLLMLRTVVRFYVRRAGRILSLVGTRFFQFGDPFIARL